MKTIVGILLVFFLGGTPAATAQNSNGCSQITHFFVGVDPFSFNGFVFGAIEIGFNTSGNSPKAIDIIINGHTTGIIVNRAAGISFDLFMPKGGKLDVSVVTYSSHDRQIGKICNTVTKTVTIPD